VLAAIGFAGKVIFLGWDSGTSAVLLYEWDWSTSPLTGKTFSDSTADSAKKWSTGVATRIGVRMVVFEDHVFICSTNGSKALAFYGIGDSNVTLVPKLNLAAGTDNHATPTWIETYRNHLFMFGWQDEDNPSVGHVARWSKPGTAQLAGDWNAIDYDYVGHEGDDIQCAFALSNNLLILKEKSIHAIYGYASANFALRSIEDEIGCFGRHAAWEWNGIVPFIDTDARPRLFAGDQAILLDDPIRDSLMVYDKTAGLEAWVSVDPDTDLAIYGMSRAGETAPTRPLVFDLRNKQWLGTWSFPSTGATTYRGFYGAAPIVRESLPGPLGAPTGLDDPNNKYNEIVSVWVNGDSTPGCVTIVERKEDAPTPGAYADVSGELPVTDPSVYVQTGLTEKHTYTTRIRHKRNAVETATGDRPTKQSLTPCAPSPIQLESEIIYNPSTQLWAVALLVTAQSGRAGATSKITLYETIYPEKASMDVLQTWTSRSDQASPTQLAYSKEYAYGTEIRFATLVEDEATTWPDSIYSYLWIMVE